MGQARSPHSGAFKRLARDEINLQAAPHQRSFRLYTGFLFQTKPLSYCKNNSEYFTLLQ